MSRIWYTPIIIMLLVTYLSPVYVFANTPQFPYYMNYNGITIVFYSDRVVFTQANETITFYSLIEGVDLSIPHSFTINETMAVYEYN